MRKKSQRKTCSDQIKQTSKKISFSQRIPKKELNHLNKMAKQIKTCYIKEDDQLLVILRTLLVTVEDINHLQNHPFYSFLNKYLLKMNQSDKENQTRMSLSREKKDLSISEEQKIEEYYNQHTRNEENHPTQSFDLQNHLDLVSEFESIQNVNLDFLNIIRKMIEFNPSNRISLDYLEKGIPS